MWVVRIAVLAGFDQLLGFVYGRVHEDHILLFKRGSKKSRGMVTMLAKVGKTTKYVSLPRNQLPLTSFDMRQRPESIDVQFEDMLIGVERLRAA
jgi:hypothetical protein